MPVFWVARNAAASWSHILIGPNCVKVVKLVRVAENTCNYQVTPVGHLKPATTCHHYLCERVHQVKVSDAQVIQLAEVTADLSEEHNTAHLAGERLEAEQAERMKLEKEVERLQVRLEEWMVCGLCVDGEKSR
ncbi:hypothetical protein E2C01_042018 [Portunus trituberculatus]|uniref:Uncharacterized protein n=1 Tax=Portunus trituberculatus TaxID=210409 RepID=A0A5B7FKN7_PORTR|nr:hypothetical protein [Portunus trituberculatus]